MLSVRLLVILLGSHVYFIHGAEECPATAVKFTRVHVDDYVRMKDSLPEITEASVCAWVDLNSSGRLPGAVFSYATQNEENAILLDKENLVFAERKYAYQSLGLKGRHHFCVLFRIVDSYKTDLRVYKNGELYIFLTYTSTTAKALNIESDGIPIIGQDQDGSFGSIENGFDYTQTYVGTIGNLGVWDYMLSQNNVTSVFQTACLEDANLKLTKEDIQVYGAARTVEFSD